MKKFYPVKPRLNKILQEKGWTKKQLSQATGINEATLSRFDNQYSHRYDHLFAIRDALGLQSIEEIYETEKEEG